MESLPRILHLPDLSWSDKLAYLAYKIREAGGKDAKDIEVKHIFELGEYVREMFIPAENIFIGRVHKAGHLMVLKEGELGLMTEAGQVIHRAPDWIHSCPGYQTALYTLTPCIGRTVFPNPEELRDIEQLESLMFEPAEPVLARGRELSRELKELLR